MTTYDPQPTREENYWNVIPPVPSGAIARQADGEAAAATKQRAPDVGLDEVLERMRAAAGLR